MIPLTVALAKRNVLKWITDQHCQFRVKCMPRNAQSNSRLLYHLRAGNLESKQAEAERLRKERTNMEKKLKLYESKILHSENNDVEAMAQKAAEREVQLKQKREELEKRCAVCSVVHCMHLLYLVALG